MIFTRVEWFLVNLRSNNCIFKKWQQFVYGFNVFILSTVLITVSSFLNICNFTNCTTNNQRFFNYPFSVDQVRLQMPHIFQMYIFIFANKSSHWPRVTTFGKKLVLTNNKKYSIVAFVMLVLLWSRSCIWCLDMTHS